MAAPGDLIARGGGLSRLPAFHHLRRVFCPRALAPGGGCP